MRPVGTWIRGPVRGAVGAEPRRHYVLADVLRTAIQYQSLVVATVCGKDMFRSGNVGPADLCDSCVSSLDATS